MFDMVNFEKLTYNFLTAGVQNVLLSHNFVNVFINILNFLIKIRLMSTQYWNNSTLHQDVRSTKSEYLP